MLGRLRRAFSHWRHCRDEQRRMAPHHDRSRPRQDAAADRRVMDFGRMTTGSMGGAWDDVTAPRDRRHKPS